MRSADALHELERLLASRGTSITTVSVRDGIDAMIEFYREVRADDCVVDADGDMLLFQWGTYNLGNGPSFELDITRQFIREGGEDEDIWQLSLTFVFPPKELERGECWCQAPAELDEFVAFVRSHAAFAAALESAPLRVELDLENVG
jgi:hypothetical protein